MDHNVTDTPEIEPFDFGTVALIQNKTKKQGLKKFIYKRCVSCQKLESMKLGPEAELTITSAKHH